MLRGMFDLYNNNKFRQNDIFFYQKLDTTNKARIMPILDWTILNCEILLYLINILFLVNASISKNYGNYG
jgi:3'-phosphoadenosine 5'-phosphosulfate sulfotransferase (PAPS reductase)/FAD synthetase